MADPGPGSVGQVPFKALQEGGSGRDGDDRKNEIPHNDGSMRFREQGRQAEYDRLTALPAWVRTWGKCPVRPS
jgi:hypothetical protein